MSTGSSYRGFWLALFVLVTSFATLIPIADRAIAVETSTTPIEVYTTKNNLATPDLARNRLQNLTFDRLTTWSSLEDQRTPDAPGARHANLSGGHQHFFITSYAAEGTELLNGTVRVFYTTDGSAPSKAGSSVRLTSTAQGGAGGQSAVYRGSLTVAQLAGAAAIRFMIEISDATNSPTACDFGKNIGGPRISQDPCPNEASINQGYLYRIDPTRPTIETSVNKPAIVASGTLVVPQARAITPDPNQRITLGVNGTATGTGLQTKINRTATLIWQGTTTTVPLHCVSGPAWTCPAPSVFREYGGQSGFNRSYIYDPAGLPRNQATSFIIQARDFTGGTIGTTATVHNFTLPVWVDTLMGNVTYRNAIPTPRAVGAINVTGVGAQVLLNISTDEPHLNRLTTNTTAVRAYLWASNAANETCNPADKTKCRFITDLVPLKFKMKMGGATNAANTQAYWEGLVNLTNTAPNGNPTDNVAFNLHMGVVVLDAAGNSECPVLAACPPHRGFAGAKTDWAQTTRLNVMRLQPGAPVITPTKTATGFFAAGPYNVEATITDANPGVDPALVKLRFSNITGDLEADPAGWKKIASAPVSIYEKSADSTEGTTFKWAMPDARDGVVIAYEFRAQDQYGNLAVFPAYSGSRDNVTESTLKFTVDKQAPSLDEVDPKAYRGTAALTLEFVALDASAESGASGSGINESTVVLNFRAKGTSTYEKATMTEEGPSIFAGKVEGDFAHGTVVEYYAEAKDAVGNAVTNGTATAPKTFTMDLLKPATTLNPVEATSTTGNVTLTAVATDADSGVETVTFEGRFRESDGTYSDWQVVGESPVSTVALCLAPGTSYDFRAFATDKAGNVGDKSEVRSVTVNAPGCREEIVVTITEPSPGLLVDGQGGSGVKRIGYSAASTGAFTPQGFIRIRIEFSPDDGKHWVVIAPDEANTGEYNWTVNAPTCDRCLLRITATGPGGLQVTESSPAFSIVNGSPTTDLDGNGVYDECELRYFGDMGRVDDGTDDDGDGLDNQQECVLGTDPINPDTDGDSASDGSEHKLGRNPLSANDKPSDTDLRFEEWGSYYLLVPALFLAVMAVFLLGIARRW